MSLIDEIKQIDIVSFLEARGFKGAVRGHRVWFMSPARPEETKPSFCVFVNSNRWVDYGAENRTGDILDLVQQLEGCDTKTAVEILKKQTDSIRFEPIDIPTEPLLTVSSVYDSFISPDLIMYLKSRKIPKEIYSRFTKEAHYWFKDSPDKKYRAVGFKNDSGGWELRNGIGHKYATSPKDSTTFLVGSSSCCILEGMFDFLSAVTYFGESFLDNDIYVANGLGLIYRNLDKISRYKIVNIYLDKGKGADATVDLIRSRMHDGVVVDHRYLFDEQSKDFNEFWCNLNKK
jgi:hypothetical protein